MVASTMTDKHVSRRSQVIALSLMLALFISSLFAIVYSQYLNRFLFVELQDLYEQRDAIEVEWGQLELEQSAWSTHGRITRIAQQELGMLRPQQNTHYIARRDVGTEGAMPQGRFDTAMVSVVTD